MPYLATYSHGTGYLAAGVGNKQQIVGPVVADSGNWYLLRLTTGHWEMAKSTDGGESWTEQDSANRPVSADWLNGSSSGATAIRQGTVVFDSGTDRIYCFNYILITTTVELQVGVTYFDTSTDTWSGSVVSQGTNYDRDAQVSHLGLATVQASSTAIYVHHIGATEKIMGTDYGRTRVSTFNPSTNSWTGTPQNLNHGLQVDSGPGPIAIYNGTPYAIEARSAGLFLWSNVASSPTNQGSVGDTSTWSTVNVSPYTLYAAEINSTWEMGFQEWGENNPVNHDWQWSTNPNSTWNEVLIQTTPDNLWGRDGHPIIIDGDVRYFFYIRRHDSGTAWYIGVVTKNAGGSFTSEEVLADDLDGGGNFLYATLVSPDTGADDAVFALTYSDGVPVELKTLFWDRGGTGQSGLTREHTTDAVTVVPGAITGLAFPNIMHGHVVFGFATTIPPTVVGVNPSNHSQMVFFSNWSRGMDDDAWVQIDSRSFADDIMSMSVSTGAVTAIACQLANGDVYVGAYTASSNTWGDAPPRWWRDTQTFINGPIFTPRLVAQPGDPGEGNYGAIAVWRAVSGDKMWVFYHGPDGGKTRIFWSAAKQDALDGEFNSLDGGYFSPPQPLDPTNSDDQFLALADHRVAATDSSGSYSSWVGYPRPYVLYTREGASQTNLVARVGWSTSLFEMWTDASSGNFQLRWPDHYNGSNTWETSGNIAYNASAATVEAAFESFTQVTAATVTGSGTQNDPWIVSIDDYQGFTGYHPQPINLFEPLQGTLSGGAVYVGVPTQEIDLGVVKHQRRYGGWDRFRRDLSAYYAANVPRLTAVLGTDDKPVLIQLPYSGSNAKDDVGEWDTWDPANTQVLESGIGTKTVHSNAGEQVPLQVTGMAGSHGIQPANVWFEARYLIFIEASTQHLIWAYKILFDDDIQTSYNPVTEIDWSYYTVATEPTADQLLSWVDWDESRHPYRGFGFLPSESGAARPWHFWPLVDAAWPAIEGVQSRGMYAIPTATDWWGSNFATSDDVGVTQARVPFRHGLWVDSNEGFHRIDWKQNRSVLGFQYKTPSQSHFQWVTEEKPVATFSTTPRLIGSWAVAQEGDVLHIVTQELNHDGSAVEIWAYFYHRYNMLTHTLTIEDELIHEIDNSNGTAGNPQQNVTTFANERMDRPSIAVRSDGHIAVYHLDDPRERTAGFWGKEVAISVRDTGGTWTKHTGWMPAGNYIGHLHGSIVYGASDRLHVLGFNQDVGSSFYWLWHQSMDTSGTKDTQETIITPSISNTWTSQNWGFAWQESGSTYVEFIYVYRPTSTGSKVYSIEFESGADPTLPTPHVLNNYTGSDFLHRKFNWATANEWASGAPAKLGSATYFVGFFQDNQTFSSLVHYFNGLVYHRKGGYGKPYEFPRYLAMDRGRDGDGFPVPSPTNTVPFEDERFLPDFMGTSIYERDGDTYIALTSDNYLLEHYLAVIEELTHTTDAVLAAKNEEHTTDAILRKTTLRVHETNALLQVEGGAVSLEHSTNVYLVRTNDHTTDAILAFLLGHTTDAHLRATMARTHTTDASLAKLQKHTTDAVLAQVVTVNWTGNVSPVFDDEAPSVTKPVLQETGRGGKSRRPGVRTIKK
jgi:hypothetical protein